MATREGVQFTLPEPAPKVKDVNNQTFIHPQRRPTASTQRDFKRRLGVDERGQYTYKKTPSSTLMASLQLGLQHSIGSIEPKPRRDILMTDFEVVDTVEFPAAGSESTPGHKFKDFTFKTYSPEAFRFFREAFGILAEDFLVAMCAHPLREVSNPGASGSLFYLSADDAFIIKTVQKKEAKFLQKLLPGYYLNLTQNKRTLLPKFFGLYRYKCSSVNIRIVVMNNLLPSSLRYHEKYDLKGSTYKRKANSDELTKRSPTFKDLDFMERHEEGIMIASEKYEALLKSVDRDCKVLQSFGIMDYSLLLGVFNLDQAQRERTEASLVAVDTTDGAVADVVIPSRIELSKNYSIVSTENIPLALQAEEQQQHYPEGYIQGRIQGDHVLLYLGVIDILQSYRLKKKLEHTMKSVIADGNTVSVHNPIYYARRFQDFITGQVFKREKKKYSTRKNPANVQFRGVRKIGPPSAYSGRGVPHQTGQDSRTLSPLHESHMATQSLAVQQQQRADGVRQRSYSASIPRGPRENLLPALEVYKSSSLSDKPPATSKGQMEETTTPSSPMKTGGVAETLKEEVVAESVLDKRGDCANGVGVEETMNDTGDFGHDVRGTSTPIDISPDLKDHSRTFDTNYNTHNTIGASKENVDTVDTEHIELSITFDQDQHESKEEEESATEGAAMEGYQSTGPL